MRTSNSLEYIEKKIKKLTMDKIKLNNLGYPVGHIDSLILNRRMEYLRLGLTGTSKIQLSF